MLKINMIGCGNAGRTLGRLWAQQHVLAIGGILTRSLASAENAAAFIGAGRAVESVSEMECACLYLIGTPDDNIEQAGVALAAAGILKPGDIVFHLSGALSSRKLAQLEEKGAAVASVHPVKTFADPAHAAETFAGTFCGIEGSPAAAALLADTFTAIGGKVFTLETERKALYHAATVIVSNYQASLMELGTRVFERAGVVRSAARQIMEPLARETLANIFELDAVRALTGPIARGDGNVVAEHVAALASWQRNYMDLYCLLGQIALHLARQKGTAASSSLDIIENILANPIPGAQAH